MESLLGADEQDKKMLCQLSTDCLSKNSAEKIGRFIGNLHSELSIDLSGLREIRIVADYPAALARLSEEWGRQIGRTEQTTGVGLASAQTNVCDTGLVHVVIISDTLVQGIVGEDEVMSRADAHIILHELIHIQDSNNLWHLGDSWINPSRETKFGFLFDIAISAWKEFYANALAAMFFNMESDHNLDLLAGALDDVPGMIQDAVIEFKWTGDASKMMHEVIRHFKLLINSAAYVLGTLDTLRLAGCDSDYRHKVDTALAHNDRLDVANFRKTWNGMAENLGRLRVSYPNWSEPTEFCDFVDLMEIYLQEYGLFIYESEDGLGVNLL